MLPLHHRGRTSADGASRTHVLAPYESAPVPNVVGVAGSGIEPDSLSHQGMSLATYRWSLPAAPPRGVAPKRSEVPSIPRQSRGAQATSTSELRRLAARSAGKGSCTPRRNRTAFPTFVASVPDPPGEAWRRVRELNPCCASESRASWATRRTRRSAPTRYRASPHVLRRHRAVYRWELGDERRKRSDPSRVCSARRTPVLLVVRAPRGNRTHSSAMARQCAAGTPVVRKCASSGTIRVLFVGSEACSRVHLTREEMLLAAALTLPPWAFETPPIPNRDLVERLRRRGRGAPPRAKWRCSVTLRVSLLARQARSLLHIPLAPSQRIERCSPDLETGWPPWAARHRPAYR